MRQLCMPGDIIHSTIPLYFAVSLPILAAQCPNPMKVDFEAEPMSVGAVPRKLTNESGGHRGSTSAEANWKHEVNSTI